MESKWLTWATKLQAIAQNGLTYCKDPFDIERFKEIRVLAAEILEDHSDADLPYIHDLFSGEVGYATPKVAVRGVVFRDDALLLVRERADGCWALPGGWVDVNESPSESVVREIYEESGYQTKALKLLACYDRQRHAHPPHPFHIYKLYFRCEVVGRAPSVSIETDDARFFGRDQLPQLSTGLVTSSQIARFFEHLREPDLPTDFD